MPSREERGRVWAIEVLVVALTTLVLLPVSCLYAMDLAAGMITPDLEWAVAAWAGLFGLWMAVLKPDTFFGHRPRARWAIVVFLVASVVTLGYLAWGSSQSTAPGLTWLILSAPMVVAVHQIVRLIRLRQEPSTDRLR